MHRSTLSREEFFDKQLIEELSQLQQDSLGEGAAVCEVCGERLGEGEPLVVFAFRPADQPAFEIGHVKCVDCRHEPTEFLTLGVREIVLDGRVGICTDHARQSSWPVLLSPRPRAVSPADATTIHPLPGITWFRRPIPRSEVYTAVDSASARKPWQRPVVRTDSTDGDTDTLSRAPAEIHGGVR